MLKRLEFKIFFILGLYSFLFLTIAIGAEYRETLDEVYCPKSELRFLGQLIASPQMISRNL